MWSCIFEAFRGTCLRYYSLDPAHFYTAPRLALKACLKKTGFRLELLSDPDMLLMFERGIRGGITQAVHRYALANNKYLGDLYYPNKESSYLQYLNANNLYCWAMSHFQLANSNGLKQTRTKLALSPPAKSKVTC